MRAGKQNWNAQDYAKHSSAQAQWADELINKLGLKGNESLLDIGCGDGKITAKISLALVRGQVLGIDASPEMIRLASVNFPPDKYPALSFTQMDATAICLLKNFDIVFSNATLHWVKDQIAVLKGVKAALKPGGKVLFQMGGSGNADDVFQVVNKIIGLSTWQRYFDGFIPPYHFYGVQEYKGWLEQCGFRILRVELISKDMKQQGKDGFKGWLRTTWFPYTDRLPSELRDIFLNEIIKTYLESHSMDSEGNIHVGMVRLEVEANID